MLLFHTILQTFTFTFNNGKEHNAYYLWSVRIPWYRYKYRVPKKPQSVLCRCLHNWSWMCVTKQDKHPRFKAFMTRGKVKLWGKCLNTIKVKLEVMRENMRVDIFNFPCRNSVLHSVECDIPAPSNRWTDVWELDIVTNV